MMSFCEACQWIRDYAPGIAMGNGISEEQCNHLTENEGLIGENDNCADLQTLMDCLIGNAAEELRGVPLCDIKDWLGDMLANFHTIGTALVCNECGQWGKINEIERALRLQLSQTFVTLRKNIDYEVIALNGFRSRSPETETFSVQASVNNMVATFRLRATNPAMPTNNMLRHDRPQEIISRGFAPTAVDSSGLVTPNSRGTLMVAVRFLGEYERFNDYPWATQQTISNPGWGPTSRQEAPRWNWPVNTRLVPASQTMRSTTVSTNNIEGLRLGVEGQADAAVTVNLGNYPILIQSGNMVDGFLNADWQPVYRRYGAVNTSANSGDVTNVLWRVGFNQEVTYNVVEWGIGEDDEGDEDDD